MKETKKPEEVSAARAAIVRRAWMDRTRAMHEARSVLSGLELSLAEHSAELQKAELKMSRFSEEIRRLIYGGYTACIVEDAGLLASQMLAGKSLAAIVLEQQKLLDARYRRINFGQTGSPEDDLVAFKVWDGERAAVLILKTAVTLAKKALALTNKTSMTKFAHGVRELRIETAREFLQALRLMQTAVQTDQALAEGLDIDELQFLRPKPFPSRILGSETVAWLLDALAEKLIQPGDLGGLGLDTVSRADA
jgi:hypothetical protein